MTGLEIVIRKAGEADQIVPLPVGRSTVGRAESNDIVLADIGVSRRHLTLTAGPDRTLVAQDLGSGNGTWLRGSRLEGATPVRMGEILLVDPFTIEVRQAQEAPRYTPRSQAHKAAADARLDVIQGPNLAQGSYLVPVHGLSVGRSEYRDVVLLDPAASRHHCDVVREHDQWWLKDRGSSNGVYLNDERVTEGRLTHGDVIRIGNTELRFVLLDQVSAEGSGDASVELSLPAPDLMDDNAKTPRSASLRAHSADTEQSTLDPDEVLSGPPTRQRPAWRRPGPWLAAAASVAAIALGALAIASLALAAVLAISGPARPVALLPEREPLPPAWTLDMPSPAPSGTVEALFERGVDAMRAGRPRVALRAFHTILVQDKGNRAAERWSFTAGEHLMLDQMQTLMEAQRAERNATEARRDALLERLPRRDAERQLRAEFRDDPVVLTRLGWMPSSAEGELSKELDRAFVLANDGDHLGARQIFQSVAAWTRNPALAERARFGETASRRALAAAVATDWRLGIEAELRTDLPSARAAYRRVLAVDRDNPSARVRLGYLGGVPDEGAEARR